jgi:hypothetical protein
VNPEDAVSAHHAADDDLHLYILGHLSAAEVDVLERHLFHCPECTHRLGATAQVVATLNVQRHGRSSDKLSEPLFRSSDAGFLRSLSPLLPDRWPVQIIDTSKDGLVLLVPTHLLPGALIQVQIGKAFALGEVGDSKQISEHEFHTGIRLQDITVGREKMNECDEQKRLAAELSRAFRYIVEIQGTQIASLRLGDTRTEQFEQEIRAALQTWRRARRLYMAHLQEHGC